MSLIKKTFGPDPCFWKKKLLILSGFVGKYDHKVDVYSFGIVLWQLLTRQMDPFPDSKNNPLDHFSFNKRPEIPAEVPESISALIQRCWDSEPNIRPEFKSVFFFFFSK